MHRVKIVIVCVCEYYVGKAGTSCVFNDGSAHSSGCMDDCLLSIIQLTLHNRNPSYFFHSYSHGVSEDSLLYLQCRCVELS